jgi:polysaccharide export outer membrane protein
MALSGCQSLPHDGPSARGVEESAPAGLYALVDLDYAASQVIAAHPPAALRALAPASSAAPVDLIGEGDVLSVTIFEPGSGPSARGDDDDDSRQSLPRVTVDRGGTIPVPYAGNVAVAGMTAQQAAAAVRSALRGRLINPQVVVTLASNVANAVTVIGEVKTSGRFALSTGADRLLDVLAAAGGSTKPAPDTVVTVVRGEQSVRATLADLLADPAENIRLAPRDQVRVAFSPRKFSTFGALARASQIAIEDERLSLAGTLSRMGGLDPATANAQSVMVFRLERPEVARALGLAVTDGRPAPVIYRLNLREPAGLFVANNFEVRDQDLIYVPRADAAEVRKFFELAAAISRVGYDISVTRLLP